MAMSPNASRVIFTLYLIHLCVFHCAIAIPPISPARAFVQICFRGAWNNVAFWLHVTAFISSFYNFFHFKD